MNRIKVGPKKQFFASNVKLVFI